MATMQKAFALALLGLALLGGPAHADPMRCSNLYAACVADCRKAVAAASLPICITNCSQRRGSCARSGCWISPTQHYCNLQRG